MTGADSTGAAAAAPELDSAAYGELVDALRELQDAVAASAPVAARAVAVATDLRRTAGELRAAGVASVDRRFGRLEVVGRGQTMCPPLQVSRLDADGLRATVQFGPFHGGFGDHVHGGAVALVLNEAMGTLANTSPDLVRVAAYVHVDYRAAALLGASLALRADVAELKGRKQTVTATLSDGERTVAEGEGLFLALSTGG